MFFLRVYLHSVVWHVLFLFLIEEGDIYQVSFSDFYLLETN